MAFPVPKNEVERLAALSNFELNARSVSPEFDAIARLAADVLGCPIALVTLLGEHDQWFKAKCGLEQDSTPREVAFCNYTILGNEPMIVSDARRDQRFKDNPLVLGEPNVVFYAGIPISIDGIHNLGAICVIDTIPRCPTALQIERLGNLAKATQGLFAAYKSAQEAELARRRVEENERELSRVLTVMDQITALSGVGGWQLELDREKLTWTKQTKKIHEVSEDYEPQLDQAISFYAPKARPVIVKSVERAIETGTSWDLELPLITAQGREIWVRAVGRPTQKNGVIDGLIGAFQDVTERRENDYRIRDSEDKARNQSHELRTILDNMDQGVSVFDSEQNLTTWNERYIEIFDKSPGEVYRGVPFRELLEKEKARGDFEGCVDDHICKLMGQLNRQQPASYQFQTKGGKIINSAHSPMPGGGWVGTHSDVTAQVVAAKQARTIIETVVDGIITIDGRGLIRGFNPASERMFGYSAHEVLGLNADILLSSDQSAKHSLYRQNSDSAEKQRVIGNGRELIGRRKNGSTFPLELSLSIAADKGRRTFTGILRDITERRQMDLMKDQFVSNVSHELRTPLTTIHCSLGLLRNETQHLLDEKCKRLLELACNGCSRLSNIVNDILDMEKIAHGKMDYRFEVVEISERVCDVVQQHMSYAEMNEVLFEVQRAAHPIYCSVDPSRFSQALVNLLSNAAKFSPPGSTVTFAIDSDTSDTVRISVIDRGPGISSDFAPRVFEKFAQADSSTTRRDSGSGLGLNITQEIIHSFGGKINFETREGTGTTFWIELPTVEAPDQEV